MSQAKHEYHLHTEESGRVTGTAWTNDNLDRGEPSEDAHWDVSYRDRAHALQATDGTHVGVIGCQVNVYLDGKKVNPQGDEVHEPPRMRPRI